MTAARKHFSCALLNYLKDNKYNSLQLTLKYTCIFIREHDLFFSLAVFLELRSLKTAHNLGQMTFAELDIRTYSRALWKL